MVPIHDVISGVGVFLLDFAATATLIGLVAGTTHILVRLFKRRIDRKVVTFTRHVSSFKDEP